MNGNFEQGELVDTLLQWMVESGVHHMRVRDGARSIELTMQRGGVAAVPALAIASPVSGQARLHHSVQDKPFIQAGDQVEAGDILALVAQGLVYVAVRAPRAGTAIRIAVVHGDAVVAGAPLVEIA